MNAASTCPMPVSYPWVGSPKTHVKILNSGISECGLIWTWQASEVLENGPNSCDRCPRKGRNCHMTPQSAFWVSTLRNEKRLSVKISAPGFHSTVIHSGQDMQAPEVSSDR